MRNGLSYSRAAAPAAEPLRQSGLEATVSRPDNRQLAREIRGEEGCSQHRSVIALSGINAYSYTQDGFLVSRARSCLWPAGPSLAYYSGPDAERLSRADACFAQDCGRLGSGPHLSNCRAPTALDCPGCGA